MADALVVKFNLKLMQLFFLVAVDIIALAIAQLLLKKGVLLLGMMDFSLVNLGNLILAVFKNFYILGGLFLMGVGFMFWLFILSKINLNIIYPISSSLTLVAVIIGSFLLFKENLGLLHVVGTAFIVLGIFLILHR